MNPPVGIYNICEYLTLLAAYVQSRCAIDICDCHIYVLIGNFDTSLLLFLKGHVDKPLSSDWMF